VNGIQTLSMTVGFVNFPGSNSAKSGISGSGVGVGTGVGSGVAVGSGVGSGVGAVAWRGGEVSHG
jgi:hypothetical protein